jgi:hypothetical protein
MEQQLQQGLGGWECLSTQRTAAGTNKTGEFSS